MAHRSDSPSMDRDPQSGTQKGRSSSVSSPRDKQLEDLERRNQQLQDARNRLEDQVAQLQDAQQEAEDHKYLPTRSSEPSLVTNLSVGSPLLEDSVGESFSNRVGQKLERDNAELRRRLMEKQAELDRLREKLDALQSGDDRATLPQSRAQTAAAAIAERRMQIQPPSTSEGEDSPRGSSARSVQRAASHLKKRDVMPSTADFSGRSREELERELAQALAAAERSNGLFEAERNKTASTSQRVLDNERQEVERRKRYEANRDAEVEKLHGIITALEKQYLSGGKARNANRIGDPAAMGQGNRRSFDDQPDEKRRVQGQYRNLERQLNNDSQALDANMARHRKSLRAQKAPDLDGVAETMEHLNERDRKWRELAKMSRQLQEETPQEGDLVTKLRTLAYLFETRPILIRALYELFKLLQKTLKLNTSHRKAVEARPLSRLEAVAQHMALREEVETAKEGNRWIIANLFTDFELYHIGASPSLFVPDGRRPTWRDIVLPEKYQRLIAAAGEQQLTSTGQRENSPEPPSKR